MIVGDAPRTRPADSAGLVVALVERALSEGGLLLTRTAPGCPCFCRLAVQPTLFGGVDLVREWGRLAPTPTATRRLVAHHESLGDAVPPLGEAVQVRLRHGYRARALPARFVPSASAVYWCPVLEPPPPGYAAAATCFATRMTSSKSGSGWSWLRTQVQRTMPPGSMTKTERCGMPE